MASGGRGSRIVRVERALVGAAMAVLVSLLDRRIRKRFRAHPPRDETTDGLHVERER